jgi:sigma-B regulation protein RsbU (phosphoserine phosphatase)
MYNEPDKTDLLKANILIVDDNLKNLQVLGNILNIDLYNVEFAINGRAAIEWIQKKNFDLILLDVMMPEIDGFEVCEKIKSYDKNKNTPVIFLTAKTDLNSIIQGFDLGAVDYIIKPFNKRELLARVSTHLELKKSRDIIEDYAKDQEYKNKLITYSIKYAKNIQNAVMHSRDKILESFREYFLLFKPKDIISGDFYWSHAVNDNIIVAVIDCTGHGVPGALMSMLGVTFLNEIVNIDGIINPNMILNSLREKIINALGQKGISDEVHDGMDASIISINKKQNTLQFSGANNSLFLIRERELHIFKGNTMPVGYEDNMEDFTSCELTLSANDVIYLFSDGYSDQFGGEKGKKLKINSFKEILLDIHLKSMTEQNEILNQHFEQWKGDLEQVDDVTVLGIRI